jgi:hypothetical protein
MKNYNKKKKEWYKRHTINKEVLTKTTSLNGIKGI